MVKYKAKNGISWLRKKMGHFSTYSSLGGKSMLYLQGNMTG